MLVQDFMSRDVMSLDPKASLQDCLAFFHKHRLRRAPVVRNGRMVGFISERKLLSMTPGTVAQASSELGQVSLDMSVEHVMSRDVRTIHSTGRLEDAADIMYSEKIGGLPVIDSSDRLVGMLTESDLFRALWGILHGGTDANVLIEEDAGNHRLNDLVALADQHGCAVHSLIRYPGKSSKNVAVVRLQGGALDAFLEDLWSLGMKVLEVRQPVLEEK